MKISLSNEDKNAFKKLLETKDLNITVSDILLETFQYVDFVNHKDFEKRFSLNHSITKTIQEIIIENFGIEDDSLKEAICSQISVSKCNEKDYKNEYVNYISNKNFKNNSYKLETISYEPYQLFALNEISIDDNYKETLNIGFFENKFYYSALFENNDLWMSVNPNEIETMREPISRAHGNVLVLGLGMAYVAYMMSKQKKVNSITIVEHNKQNISALKTVINDLFDKENKVKIICDDAISFLNTNHDFDYIFADLWFNPEDGLEKYMKLKEIQNKYDLEMDYWLETSLKQMKRRYLIELINEQINGSAEANYLNEETAPDRIFKKLYNETKNYKIRTINDIRELLKWDR